MITKTQYLNGDFTHQEYYGQWAKTLSSQFGKTTLKRIKESTDPHFNDILWDLHHNWVISVIGSQIREANGNRRISRSDTVCAMKAAAHFVRDNYRDNS